VGDEDIALDQNENIYILTIVSGPVLVWKFDQNGNLVKEYVSFEDEDAVGMNIGGGPTKLFCNNSGRLFLQYFSEKKREDKIFQFGTTTTDFTPEQQKATLRKGFVGVNGLSLNQNRIFEITDGKTYLMDNLGKAVTQYKHGVNPHLFLGTDANGSIYLHGLIWKKILS